MAKGKKTGGRNFQPGVITNPNGRPRLSEDIREARRLTQTKFTELVNKYLLMDRNELAEAAQDPKTTTLELIVLKVIQQAIAKGDQIRLSFILDRLIGKVPDKLNMNIDPQVLDHIKEYESKTTEELLEILNELNKAKK